MHFFAAAAEAMRRVLINHARGRARLKRGGRPNRAELDRLTGPATVTDEDLLELNDAIDRLATEFPIAAEVVKLRFFAGMTLRDVAEALGISSRTADRHWSFARGHRLGQSEKARDTLGRLREVMKNPELAGNPEAKAFVREAETIEHDRALPADPFAH